MEWVETTQKSVPLLPRQIATKFSIGKFISTSILHDFNIKHYKYINNDKSVQAFFSKDELEKLYEILWENVVSGKMKDFLDDYHAVGLEFVNFSKIIYNKDFTKLTNLELKDLFDEWMQKYTRFIGYIYNGNFAVNISTKKILNLLSKKEEDEEFRILTIPVQETDIAKRQARILSVLRQIRLLNKPFLDIKDLPLKLRNEIIDIHETYRYLGAIFLTSNKYPYLEDFIEEIKGIMSLEEKNQEDLNSKKQKLLEELNINDATKRLIDELANLSYYRTEMLSYVQKGEYFSMKLFDEIAGRLNISYRQLMHMTYEELCESLLDGKVKISLEQIDFRIENYRVELVNGEVIVSFPEKVSNQEEVYELKGNCASKGKATGKVRVLHNSSEASKLQPGEILVTFMTTPDYVMAMQKAGAIVTNDGGITCHAAIVSRELGKPCVIGTRKGTSVLHDGDLVEVDADKGIVKIIKKA